MWWLHGLCREMGWLIESDRPLGKEGVWLWPVGLGWIEGERVCRELWWVGW